MANSPDFQELLNKAAKEYVRAYAEKLEEVVSESIVGGKYGVLCNQEDSWVDERVPYGTIWVLPGNSRDLTPDML